MKSIYLRDPDGNLVEVCGYGSESLQEYRDKMLIEILKLHEKL